MSEVVKKSYESKTLWTNLVMAVLAFFPGTQSFVAGNPELFVWVFAGVNVLLRFLTKDKIQLK